MILQVFLRVAERLLAIEQRHVATASAAPARAGPRARCASASIHSRYGFAVASVRFSSSSSTMRPCSRSTSSILPGCSRHFLTILRFGNVEHADFGGHHDEVVVGDDVARRAQAVAVERRADLAAVGERHRRRAVPRLHQRRVVFVERAAILVHQRIAGPRLGNHQHHRVRERIAAHHEQLERVVERRRVGLAVVDQRPELVQVVAEHRRWRSRLRARESS